MLSNTNPIIKHRAGLLNLAEELGNVSKAWVASIIFRTFNFGSQVFRISFPLNFNFDDECCGYVGNSQSYPSYPQYQQPQATSLSCLSV